MSEAHRSLMVMDGDRPLVTSSPEHIPYIHQVLNPTPPLLSLASAAEFCVLEFEGVPPVAGGVAAVCRMHTRLAHVYLQVTSDKGENRLRPPGRVMVVMMVIIRVIHPLPRGYAYYSPTSMVMRAVT